MTATDTEPRNRRALWLAAGAAAALAVAAAAFWAIARHEKPAPQPEKSVQAKPALSVAVTIPQTVDWPRVFAANGNVAAWQEAVIGPEIANFRLTEVLVNVGDVVKKGQLLARISEDTVAAELAQARASAAEAQAMLAEARANADRARRLQTTGAMSGQQINQLLTAEQTAIARLNAAKARIEADELRLAHTRVLAPDDGVISARTATVGSLAQPGQELFRLIRGGRLEWRAEVTAAELAKIAPGTPATLITPDGKRVQGSVRMVAPTVDPQTRNGLVYVDLPAAAGASGARAGMFARGEFELGRAPALTLPQSAVLLREGFAYVFRVEPDNRVAQTKVAVGRRAGERIEIVEGIGPDARVVASGVGFLADGDPVRVVDAPGAEKTAAK
jgi:RND family efflux transporter MFP subunit